MEPEGVKENQEQGRDQEVFTFPELVYKELLVALIALVVLIVWSLEVDAPLKAIADPNWTENPAKAPWYFVGLQDLLVYFDPWIAGVSIPLLIILGLAVLPYLDPNPKGVGRYNLKDRRVVVPIFLFGYLLWFALIIVGQFLRGPNWQFYWPWEDWAVEKSTDTALINLPNGLGGALLAGYFVLGLLLPTLFHREMFRRMGAVRYLTAWTLALLMFGVAGKMALRLLFHVKYILTTPYFSI